MTDDRYHSLTPAPAPPQHVFGQPFLTTSFCPLLPSPPGEHDSAPQHLLRASSTIELGDLSSAERYLASLGALISTLVDQLGPFLPTLYDEEVARGRLLKLKSDMRMMTVEIERLLREVVQTRAEFERMCEVTESARHRMRQVQGDAQRRAVQHARELEALRTEKIHLTRTHGLVLKMLEGRTQDLKAQIDLSERMEKELKLAKRKLAERDREVHLPPVRQQRNGGSLTARGASAGYADGRRQRVLQRARIKRLERALADAEQRAEAERQEWDHARRALEARLHESESKRRRQRGKFRRELTDLREASGVEQAAAVLSVREDEVRRREQAVQQREEAVAARQAELEQLAATLTEASQYLDQST